MGRPDYVIACDAGTAQGLSTSKGGIGYVLLWLLGVPLNAAISHASAAQTLANLSVETHAARADAKSSADRTAHHLAAGPWALVCGLLLDLVTSALGGWPGAGHVHRVYHLRGYSRTPRR